MIKKYVYKLSIFNLANKPTPTFKSSVLYILNHCINQRNHAHPHYFQKSQISLTIEHKTKNKDYQWREDEVANLGALEWVQITQKMDQIMAAQL